MKDLWQVASGKIEPPQNKIQYQLDDYVPVGSCLRGHITATYDALVAAFGKPNIEPSDKVWNEWSIRFSDDDDDIYATIYDWKEEGAYDSHVGEYRWHIGGQYLSASWYVSDVLNASETMERTDA